MATVVPEGELHRPTLPHGTRLYASTQWFTNTNLTELFAASMLLAWGLWGLTWLVAHALGWHQAPLHVTHATDPPLWALGGTSGAVGAAHLATRMRAVRLRMLWLFLELMWWAMTGLMVASAVPSSAAVVMYGGMCVVVGVCYLRLYVVHGELFRLGAFVAPMRLAWAWFRGDDGACRGGP